MKLDVRSSERGLVRVFAISMTDADALALRDNTDKQKTLLGADYLDTDFTEVFPISDLSDLGLVGYLTTGNGVPHTQLNEDRQKLSALDGWVMLVFSNAFGGVAQTLTPAAPLNLIGTYAEEGVDWSPVDITLDGAKPFERRTPSDAMPTKTSYAWIVVGITLLFVLILIMIL